MKRPMNRIIQILDATQARQKDHAIIGTLLMPDEAKEIRELATEQHASTGKLDKKYTKAGRRKK